MSTWRLSSDPARDTSTQRVGDWPQRTSTSTNNWVPEDIFQTALGRAAEPVEVSNLVVYLASDESSYSTGAEFVVDGGTVAGLAHNDFGAVEVSSQPEWVT